MEFLKTLQDIESEVFFRLLSLIGSGILAIWSAFWTIRKYKRDQAEKEAERRFQIEKIRVEQELELKKQKETEREEFLILLSKLQYRWDTHNNMQSRDRFTVKKMMDSFVTRDGGANICHLCECKNGGDHIVSSKTYTISVLMESINYSKGIQPEKQYWQNVKVSGQQHEFYFKALVSDYCYIDNYIDNMEEGDFKSLIKKKNGTHIAAFYIGRIDIRHFYLTFQFGEYDMKTKGDLLQIRNQCNKIYAMMKKSEIYKEQTELLQEVINQKKTKLIEKGLIDEKFITDYEGYLNKDIESIDDV